MPPLLNDWLAAANRTRLAIASGVVLVLLVGLVRCAAGGGSGGAGREKVAVGPAAAVQGVSVLPTASDTPPPITLTPLPTAKPTKPAPTATASLDPSITPSPRPSTTATPRRTAVASSSGSQSASSSSSGGGSGSSSRGGSSGGGSGGGSAPGPTPSPPPPIDSPAGLVAALRSGGLVVFQRHALTDWSQDPREMDFGHRLDEDPSLLRQCDAQRNLSAAGTEMARTLGASWRRLGIHFGDVVSSPFCRCRDTASLAAGSPRQNDDLIDSGHFAWDEKRVKKLEKALEAEITAPVPAGTNRLIVGHMPNLRDLIGVALEEGESAVLRVENGDIHVVRRVMAGEWAGFPAP